VDTGKFYEIGIAGVYRIENDFQKSTGRVQNSPAQFEADRFNQSSTCPESSGPQTPCLPTFSEKLL
jgi:hypothetical protein